MTERELRARLARLEERVRLLTMENDQLADRAEETMLLGHISQQAASGEEAGCVLATALEQVAILRAVPYAACYADDGVRLLPLETYTLQEPAVECGPFTLGEEVREALRDGPLVLTADETGRFPAFAGSSDGFAPGAAVIVEVQRRTGPDLVFAFATAEDDGRLEAMQVLLVRAAEIVAARLENIALLAQVTRANAQLDQKVAERTQALRASENRARTLFESALDLLFVVDDDLIVRDVNQEACRNCGYRYESFVGMDLADLTADATGDRLRASIAAAHRGSVVALEARLRRVDGTTFPAEVRFAPLEIDGQDLALVHARDLTERNTLLDQLHQAQKLEAIGRLAGGIAHDFNNILTAILGQVDLLRMDLEPNGAVAEGLDVVQDSAERAAALTRQLLAFSRKQVLEKKPVDLSVSVANLSRMLRRILGEATVLEFDLAESPAWVYGDAGRIEQIIMNLVINAQDAIEDGGSIRVAVRRSGGDASLPAATAGEPDATGDRIVLQVSDSGHGIAPEDLGRIFDPFFTTKQDGKGTGLGLSLVHGLAEQHDAAVHVSSEVGRGSTFEVVFPEIDPADSAREPAARRKTVGGGETVLLVEDDDASRAVLVRILESLGYRTLTAADGNEGVERAAGHDGPVDLVVTDVVMPRMGGPEMAAALRRDDPDLKVVYLSGYTDDALDLAEIERPGTAFLTKPVAIADLAATLRRLLDDSPARSNPEA